MLAATTRLDAVLPRRLERDKDRLAALSRALATLDPGRPKPGFARVEDTDGGWITSAAALEAGQAVRLVFGDGAKSATIDGGEARAAPARPPAKPKPPVAGQGDLF